MMENLRCPPAIFFWLALGILVQRVPEPVQHNSSTP